MDENENKDTSNVTNDENDAREEDIVADTDSDTEDVEETVNEARDDSDARFSRLESTIDRILGELSALREAQGILVENGAVINDASADDIDFTDADHFVPPSEMDLLV